MFQTNITATIVSRLFEDGGSMFLQNSAQLPDHMQEFLLLCVVLFILAL
jgi:hypothetical protein